MAGYDETDLADAAVAVLIKMGATDIVAREQKLAVVVDFKFGGSSAYAGFLKREYKERGGAHILEQIGRGLLTSFARYVHDCA